MNNRADDLANEIGHQEQPGVGHPIPNDQGAVPEARDDDAVGLVELGQGNDAA